MESEGSSRMEAGSDKITEAEIGTLSYPNSKEIAGRTISEFDR